MAFGDPVVYHLKVGCLVEAGIHRDEIQALLPEDPESFVRAPSTKEEEKVERLSGDGRPTQ